FRAPSLNQSWFSAVSTNFLRDPATGQLAPFEVGTYPVSNPVARSLGATDLRPEESKHRSLGFVWEPVQNLEVTGNFTGALVQPLLAPFGVTGARFFANAISTETKGYDFVINHQRGLGRLGRIDVSAAYSHNETEIVGEASTPPQLSQLREVLFDRIERRRIECGQPKDNVRLMESWSAGNWNTTLRQSRYGEFCSFTILP